MTSGGIDLGDI